MKEIPHEVTLSLAKPRKPEADRITYRKVASVETASLHVSEKTWRKSRPF